MRIVSTTYGPNFLWDSYISLNSSEDHSIIFSVSAVQNLLLSEIDSLRRSVPLPLTWLRLMNEHKFFDHLYGPIEMHCMRKLINPICWLLLLPYLLDMNTLKLGRIVGNNKGLHLILLIGIF